MLELDKSKAYDLRDLSDEQFRKIQKEFKKQGVWEVLDFEYAKRSPCVYYNKLSNRWYRDFIEDGKLTINALTLFEDKKEAVKISTQEEWDYVVDKMGFEESKEPYHRFKGDERYLRLDIFGYHHTFDYYQERGYTLISLEEFKSRYKPTLKVGDKVLVRDFENAKWQERMYVVEHNGMHYVESYDETELLSYNFIKPYEEQKKWYVIGRGVDAYYSVLSEDEVLWSRAEDKRVEEITDPEFIKHLDANAN